MLERHLQDNINLTGTAHAFPYEEDDQDNTFGNPRRSLGENTTANNAQDMALNPSILSFSDDEEVPMEI